MHVAATSVKVLSLKQVEHNISTDEGNWRSQDNGDIDIRFEHEESVSCNFSKPNLKTKLPLDWPHQNETSEVLNFFRKI